MIFTDRTITVRKGESRIDEPIVVYRGDYELEARFTILNSRFKFMSGVNMIESEKASYGQLAILTPYGGNIFSDIVRCNDGSVTFVLTAEMLNQIEEVGLYSFQIRLMDYNKESRVSIPPIEFGIEVREPIASEDHDNSVNNAIVGYSIAKVVDGLNEDVLDTFDVNKHYNKTNWRTGDRISQGKLNKIEDAIYKINQNEKDGKYALNKQMTSNFNVLQNQTTHNTSKVDAIEKELEIERKRIDSFTRLQEGSTTGDSELIDARIGADAFFYDNLGGAIRTQINDINKDKISKADLYITNLLNPNTLMENTFSEYGVIKPYDGWNITDYIEIDKNKKYSLFIFTDNGKDHYINTYVEQFDRNLEYIPDSTIMNSKLSDYSFDAKTKYIRVSGPSEYIGADGMIVLTQHEKHINSYLPYGESLSVISDVISDVRDNTKEIENIKADLYITNLLNPNTLMENTFSEYGVIKPYDGWNITDYIEIDKNKKYSLFIFTDNGKDHYINTYVEQFDRNLEYIPYSTLINSKLSDYTFDAKTKYIRVSGPSEYIGRDGMIVLTQHEKHINSYLPYGESLSVISDVRDNTKEIENIKADLYITNLLNPNTLMENAFSEYGDIKPHDGWNITDYIKIDKNKKYSLFIFTDNGKNHFLNAYVEQFDGNLEYIPDSTLINSKLCDYTFGNKTKYIRVSGPSEYIGRDGMIVLTQHEKHINSYLPYGESLSVISDIEDNTKEIENIKANTYQNVIRSINRIGYDVYNYDTPPQQSIESFKMAYDKGFRVLLCDLRFTSDNVPVLHHDDNINTYALNADGSEIQDTVLIAETTYEKLLEYDYGLYKGQQYKGTKIMHLKDMLKLCKKLGCELYIEVKAMNEAQCKIACDLVRMYAMENKTSWCGEDGQETMRYVVDNIDTARVSTMPLNINDGTINWLNRFKTGKNEVFFFAWDATELSEELVRKLIDNNIKFEIGTLDTEAGILNYFKQDDIYYYCTGIESNKIIAGKVILENKTEI